MITVFESISFKTADPIIQRKRSWYLRRKSVPLKIGDKITFLIRDLDKEKSTVKFSRFITNIFTSDKDGIEDGYVLLEFETYV